LLMPSLLKRFSLFFRPFFLWSVPVQFVGWCFVTGLYPL
jgi:hypothetical protein